MVGVFLEAATRHCEIKINRRRCLRFQFQGLPGGQRARGREQSPRSSGRRLCPSPAGLPGTPPVL